MEEREFYDLILDPQTRKRERKYALQYFIHLLVYIGIIVACHISFPKGRVGGIPVFCLMAWGLSALQYLYLCLYKGYRTLWPSSPKLDRGRHGRP